ncbi:PilX N-terminal domain-containing pilus assembly protein [Thalassotalea sp. Y01]|uniref:PilX N-terminal domain-containing pilus assembly protein n=1 Tax=Thalassotalea sp. Y01 TaxID=2729613 RepID=UPI00145DE68D|nr:PilX N-terminal domain-containing pilus assembly protein [Thalassotalea sp. Y01]NMP14846.1 hypothetical protein [Thalassotalea sp. Y01]
MKQLTLRRKQQGLAVLAISIILLILITLISLYLARSVIFEQQLVNNDMRSKRAFEAAEGGLALALEYYADGLDQDDDGNIDPVFDSDGDGIGDSATGTIGTSPVQISVNEISASDVISIEVISQGWSEDESASRTITVTLQALDPIPNMPDNPLSTRGNLDINGSASVHNPEGHSSIWSGGDIDIGSNNATATFIADPSDVNYPACMDVPRACSEIQTSNKETVGLDILEHDSDLANLTPEEMFENFFGMSPLQYKERVATVVIDPASPGDAKGCDANTYADCVEGARNEVIWYEGDLNINGGTVGCKSVVSGGNVCPSSDEAPSILIVNGDVSMSGTPHFYGVVFIMDTTEVSANATFHGAVVTGGGFNTTSGSLDIHYNTDLLKNTRLNTIPTVAAGSWRDF